MDSCVGLVYDEQMTGHKTPNSEYHEENPQRITNIWERLDEKKISERCKSISIEVRPELDETIALVHTWEHINYIKGVSSKTCRTQKYKDELKQEVYFNNYSASSARKAVQCVLSAADQVVDGLVTSAFAVVRPPGHHATRDKPMGFCLFNNVAIAASYVLEKYEAVKRILIVDWDVHHGNGTQEVFYEDDRVLFFSVHRYQPGFYPATDEGSCSKIGKGAGLGYNINVPLDQDGAGNADYLAIWDHVLIPVARRYKPDLVIVSSGFDAVERVRWREYSYGLGRRL